MNSETRVCQNCKGDFTIESDDFSFYQKIKVPPPTWCPYCRYIRKLTFVNERSLYKRVCDNCDKSIISMYHPDLSVPVWCVKCHLSDNWDARDYARGYNFSRNFFEQFRELKDSVPRRALDQNERNGTGCEYSNYCFTCKDVYLSFTVSHSENIKYSRYVFRENKNCVDSLLFRENDRVYEVVQSNNNYNSSFLIESNQCIDSHFLYDCSNCNNCCLSSGLRNKTNVFKNQQLSKEEYQKAIKDLKLETYTGQQNAKKIFDQVAKNSIHKYADIRSSVNVSGDFIENSKNVHHEYGVVDSEDSKNISIVMNGIKDCYDLISVGSLEECYEMTNAGRGGSRIIFSLSCGGGSHNLFYCDSCRGCSDCFGCVGLTKRQYCIFNKQYSKEEYEKMIEKIKQHMDEMPYVDKIGRKYVFGEYFPTELSPFTYNESSAYEEYPLSEKEILDSGYEWREPEAKSYTSTLKTEDLPDSIQEVVDEICNEVIECPNGGRVETQCTSAFKILPDELSFYRQMNLPIPRYCPNCRYHERLKWKNPFRFYKRECMCDLSSHEHAGKCANEFETMYALDRPEIIYCEKCYQKEIY